MEEELVHEFASNNFSLQDEHVAKQCVSLCASFDLSPAELVSSWELFYLNSRLEDGRVSSAQVDNFRQFLQHEQREAFRRKQADFHFYSKDDVDMLLNADSEDEDQKTPARSSKKAFGGSPESMPTEIEIEETIIGPKTPGSATNLSHPNSHMRYESSPATPFSQRSSKYTTQFVLNKDLHVEETHEKTSQDDVLRRLRPVGISHLQILNTVPKQNCRFMYDRTEDKFNFLDKRIKKFADALAAQESLIAKDHAAIASQERIFVVGMVCCDGEGHLNDKSVLLQGSVEYSGGHRVRLDLNGLERFSLFPGQVIGVEGHNPSGHCLVASRIVESLPIPADSLSSEPHAKRQVLDSKISLPVVNGSHQISMVIAAGPFTTSDNLAFEPLVDFLDFARKKRPNLLLLMGPFVDSEHPHVKLGVVDKTFRQIFEDEIRTRILEYCEEMGSGARVVLIPSVRDAHHDFVFPQPPFDDHSFEDPDNQITLLGNPAIFSLNELTIACCTVDVLRHLSSEEVSRVPASASSDRLARLAAHIVGQKSFYPLYPSPAGVPLDMSLSFEALHISCQPQVMIVPSDLAPFVKTLSLPSEQSTQDSQWTKGKYGPTLCINPGRLAKGINGGTFTDMFVVPSYADGREQRLEERIKVSIIRI